MNRSLLLIVCDFLLLSLLALAEFERSGQPVAGGPPVAERTEPTTEEDDSGISELLAAALSAEQTAQSELEAELERARRERSRLEEERSALAANLEEQRAALRERTEALAAKQTEAERLAAEREAAEERAARIAREREELAARREELSRRADELANRVESLAGEATANEEKLRERTEALRRLEERLEEQSEELAAAERERLDAEAERERLATEVASARREKELLSESLDSARRTIDLEREERSRLQRQTETLSEGVTRLAETSTEIQEEVRNLRPMTANEIYRTADENRVSLVFRGSRSGLFGATEFEETVDTVLTEIDGRPVLWLHVSQTPFADPDRRRFLESLELFLEAGDRRFRVPRLAVLADDPSLLFLPLSPEIADRLGTEVFPASDDPFRFEDLVVIDLPESRFGDSGFRIRPDRPDFLEVDNRAFSALFGEFSPAPGDLAFTRAGRFLGVVVRGGEAWMADSIPSGGSVPFGEDFDRARLEALP